MYGNEREDLRHFILDCPAYQEERRRHPGLQRPYQEEDQVIERILFENENTNIENTKETLTKFWHKREKRKDEVEGREEESVGKHRREGRKEKKGRKENERNSKTRSEKKKYVKS